MFFRVLYVYAKEGCSRGTRPGRFYEVLKPGGKGSPSHSHPRSMSLLPFSASGWRETTWS